MIPEEFTGTARPAEGDGGHAGGRDHQATELRASRRRGGDRRGARARHRPGGPGGARGRRARRARPRADRRGQHRRDPEGRGGEAAEGVRPEGDAGGQEHRLRAALRRPGAGRHGVHARPGLLRREVPAVGRQRRDDLDAGRPLRADPVRARCSTRRPAARRCVWWTSTPRATRSRGATCSACGATTSTTRTSWRSSRRRRACRCRSSGSEFEYLVQYEPPPLAMDARMGGFVEPAAP